MEEKIKLRDKLVDIVLQWQASFGVAPSITSSISEYDAAMLVGMSEKEYSDYMKDKTAVAKGTDFVYRNIWYMKDYKMAFENKKRLSPQDYRRGYCLYHR